MKRSWLVSLFRSFLFGERNLYVDRFVSIAENLSTESPSAPPREQTDTNGWGHGPGDYPSLFSSSTRKATVGTLVVADWTTRPLSSSDAVQSYLVEHPGGYYLSPSRRFVFILLRERGLVLLENPRPNATDEQISDFVFYARRSLE